MLSLKIQAILLGAVLLILVVLPFIQPETPILIGACLILIPPILAVIKLANTGFTLDKPDAPRVPRADERKEADMDVPTGSILSVESFTGGIDLLLLGWLFQRDVFNQFLGLY